MCDTAETRAAENVSAATDTDNLTCNEYTASCKGLSAKTLPADAMNLVDGVTWVALSECGF